MDDILDDLRTFIAYQVREGFASEREIEQNAAEYVQETYGRDDLKLEIRYITQKLLADHRTEQSAWTSPTDCDRLDAAFAALNRQGIVARQDFSCCNNCGHTEIWDEIEQAEKQSPVKGYVFYHLQSTERAVQSGQLFLSYGSVEDDEAELQAVAATILSELRTAGLNATWSGDIRHAIEVNGLVWHKRR